MIFMTVSSMLSLHHRPSSGRSTKNDKIRQHLPCTVRIPKPARKHRRDGRQPHWQRTARWPATTVMLPYSTHRGRRRARTTTSTAGTTTAARPPFSSSYPFLLLPPPLPFFSSSSFSFSSSSPSSSPPLSFPSLPPTALCPCRWGGGGGLVVAGGGGLVVGGG
jgi:hypothetical protein